MAKISTVVIAKNEEKTLPKLIESVKGVDEILILDTGSTDNTIEVAKSLGARVIEKTFNVIIDQDLKNKIDELIGENNIKVGDTAFNFSEARNYAASQAENDIIFMPDCDEIVEWDLPEVRKLFDEGTHRLEYNFVFSWDSEGKPLIQFIHSKFYDRRKFHWVRFIHEVLVPKIHSDKNQVINRYTDKIFLKHYQNHETNRSQYLKGLAIDYIQNPYNDRNCHYFARELLYCGKPKEAIKMFEQHIENPGWQTEKGQSIIFMGNAYRGLKDDQKAMECYARAFTYDMGRREAILELAKIKYDNKEWAFAERLYWFALQIPKSNYYANFAPNYTHVPWGQLSVCLFNQGNMEEAYKSLKKALEYEPNNQTYLNNLKFFPGEFQEKKVSIIIPTLGLRPEGLERSTKSIESLNYPKNLIETIIIKDEPRLGLPKRLNEGFKKSTGELIVFASDDTEFTPNSLRLAVEESRENDLVAFNTGELSPDKGNICEHFLVKRSFVEKKLGGKIFDEELSHCGTDNLLWAQANKYGKAVRSEQAILKHYHFTKGAEQDETYKKAWENVDKDREVLKKKLDELDELVLFTDKIKKGENFNFVKMGDGELQAMLGAKGKNCDGQQLTSELGKALKKAYKKIGKQKNTFITKWVLGLLRLNAEEVIKRFEEELGVECKSDHELLLHNNLSPQKYEFWKAIKESKRHKIFVGPTKLKEVNDFLDIDEFIEVPERNSFDFKPKIKADNAIILFSAGMASKIWISEIVSENNTCIDCGSAFDPIFVGNTRLGQISRDELRGFYWELSKKNTREMFLLQQDIHPERLFVEKEVEKDKIILDMGCGKNKTTPLAIGVDLKQGVDLVASADDLPIRDGLVDAIISRHIFEHMLDPIKTINEWLRILKKGGRVVMILPDHSRLNIMRHYLSNDEHNHAYTQETLRNLLSFFNVKIEKMGVCVKNWSFYCVFKKKGNAPSQWNIIESKDLLGEKIGEGKQRIIYKHKTDNNLVIKVLKDPNSTHNKFEYLNWLNTKSDLLVPCLGISEDGVYLVQVRGEESSEIPDIPSWLENQVDLFDSTDAKIILPKQWVRVDNKLKLCDYGLLLIDRI